MYKEFETEIPITDHGRDIGGITLNQQLAEVKAKLAHTVRGNAKRYSALTPLHILTVLAKQLPVEVQRSVVTEMSAEEPYRDIKTFITPSGQHFLYSLLHITPQQAEAKGCLEEVKHLIAEKIRRDSRVATALTPLGTLYDLLPDIKPVKICSILNEMQTRDVYRDLKTVAACSGELYLYCDLHITEKYAALLVRAAVNDACSIIVDTVREESRVYLRPTRVSLFTSQVFGIPPAALHPCIVRVLNNQECGDIRKLVHPETESVYLYSNLHMNEEHAHSVMRWLEEGVQAWPDAFPRAKP